MSDRKPLRRFHSKALGWIGIYIAMLVVAVPWYWSSASTQQWIGMPVWALISIGASLGVSILVAWQLSRPWENEVDADSEGRDQ